MKISPGVESNILPLREFKKIFPDISVVELFKIIKPNTILKTAKGDEIKQLGHCKLMFALLITGFYTISL